MHMRMPILFLWDAEFFKFEDAIKLQMGKVMYLYTVTAFFLIALMTCFCSPVTYIHKTRSKNSFR